ISAPLLVAGTFTNGLDFRHTGEQNPSPAHLAMTIIALKQAGVQLHIRQTNRCIGASEPITAPNTIMELELSNAGANLAGAVVTGGRVTVPFWPIETTQIGDRWRTILPKFGAEVSFEPVEGTDYGNLTVTGVLDNDGQPVVTGAGELSDLAELTPTTAALALLADGPTRLTKIGHLRGHETDRLTALYTEAEKLGAIVQ